jgi:hypothetical protein
MLNPTDERRLNAHLEECKDCRTYTKSLDNTVSVLQQTLRKQWKAAPLPLQMEVIYSKINPKKGVSTFLATRIALAGVVFLLFSVIAWQSMTSGGIARQNSPEAIPMIPTPSMEHTATNASLNDCQNIKYSIQEGDTLESIARQFSVSADIILTINDLGNSSSLETGQQLVIPICETTPTSTTNPPTITITPFLEPVTSTPG